MTVAPQHQRDVDAILTRRHDNGADFWATPDSRLVKGSPFTTLDCLRLLRDLGVPSDDPVLVGATDLVWRAWRDDGRFRLAPGAIYPCQTINAARTLAHLGHASDERLARTFEHLLATRHGDGGWRCLKFSYGHGPETASSNPGPTLGALDAFRFTDHVRPGELADAVELLLHHWETRVLRALQSRTVDGHLVVERTNPRLAALDCGKKGAPNDLASARYGEILANVGRG